MQELYQLYQETSPIPVDSQVISSFKYMNWNLNLDRQQLDRKQTH